LLSILYDIYRNVGDRIKLVINMYKSMNPVCLSRSLMEIKYCLKNIIIIPKAENKAISPAIINRYEKKPGSELLIFY